MTDVVSKSVRSRMMAGIRSRDTKPETALRKRMFARGYRYKLNDKALPGKPDLVFPKYNAVIFVHGCFWHKHNCHLFKWPKSREAFWRSKLCNNAVRDKVVVEALRNKSWRVGKVWECSLKGKMRKPIDELIDEIESWLTSGEPHIEIAGNSE